MTRAHIYHSNRFDLVSYGNGLAYWLHDNANKRSLYLQGDDAALFQGEVEAWEKIDPEMSYDMIYGNLCSEYADIMEASV